MEKNILFEKYKFKYVKLNDFDFIIIMFKTTNIFNNC